MQLRAGHGVWVALRAQGFDYCNTCPLELPGWVKGLHALSGGQGSLRRQALTEHQHDRPPLRTPCLLGCCSDCGGHGVARPALHLPDLQRLPSTGPQQGGRLFRGR